MANIPRAVQSGRVPVAAGIADGILEVFIGQIVIGDMNEVIACVDERRGVQSNVCRRISIHRGGNPLTSVIRRNFEVVTRMERDEGVVSGIRVDRNVGSSLT